MKFNLSPIVSSKIIGHLSGLGIILIIFLFSNTLREKISYRSLVPPFLISICINFIFWSNGGLETQLNTFLLTLSAYFFYRAYIENNFNYCKYHTLSTILFLLNRPENFIFIIGNIFLLIFINLKILISFFLIYKYHLTTIITSILILFGFRLIYYQSILPNSVIAKKKIFTIKQFVNYLSSDNKIFDYCIGFIQSVGGWLVIVLFLMFLIFFRNGKLKLYFGLIFVFYFSLVVWNKADWMPKYRFFEFIIPLLYLALIEGLYQGLKKIPHKIKPVIILFVILYFSILGIPKIKQGHVSERELYWGYIGRKLNEVSIKNDILLTSHLGYISYYYNWNVLDWQGLTDKFIARNKRKNRKKVYEYMIMKKPSYFLPARYQYAVQFFKGNPEEMKKYFFILTKDFRRLRIPFFIRKQKLENSDFKLLFPDAEYIGVSNDLLDNIYKPYSVLRNLLIRSQSI